MAEDADSSAFGPIAYTIDTASSKPSNLPFTIDKNTGEVKTTKIIK